MEDVPEIVVICIDNSKWMHPSSAKFKDQLDAIKIYSKAKFEAHADNVVGLYTMSSGNSRHLFYPPTRSLQKIYAELTDIDCTSQSGYGDLDLVEALSFGRLPFLNWTYCPDKKFRMLLLVGGLTNMGPWSLEQAAKIHKDMGIGRIAVDIVNFYQGKIPERLRTDYRFGKSELDAFYNICNHNGNSNIVHVERGSSISDAVSRYILKQENVNVKGVLQLCGKNEFAVSFDEARGIKRGKHMDSLFPEIQQAAADAKRLAMEYRATLLEKGKTVVET